MYGLSHFSTVNQIDDSTRYYLYITMKITLNLCLKKIQIRDRRVEKPIFFPFNHCPAW